MNIPDDLDTGEMGGRPVTIMTYDEYGNGVESCNTTRPQVGQESYKDKKWDEDKALEMDVEDSPSTKGM